ncbi:MAG: potassium channel family protein [Candidatus Limnocylindrales bacterium]
MTVSGAGGRATQIQGRFQQPDEYGLALVLILATIVTIAIVGDQPYGQLFAAALSGGTLLFILRTSEAPRRAIRVATALVVLALAGTTIGIVAQNGFADGTAYGLIIAFIAVVSPIVIASRIVRHETITLRTVAGALCLYLLIGLFFATVYGLIAQFQGGFFVQTTDPDSTDFVYFSFITLTTTGYGDYTAAFPLGRMLAVTEALFGQLYLVSAVALLIANIGRSRRHGSSAEPDVLDEIGALADDPIGEPTD